MGITIVIVNYNDKEHTDTCIRTILRFPIQMDFHIVVVDNASIDGSVEYLRERWEESHKVSFIVQRKNIGFGRACNVAIEQSNGTYIAIVNPDVEVRNNTFNTLLDYLDYFPDVGIVGPQLQYEDGTVQDSYRTFPRLLDIIVKRTFLRRMKIFQKRIRQYLMWDKDKNRIEPVDWLVGAFWIIRRSILKRTGVFDPRYFLFFEDVDLCRRVWLQGYKVVYVPATSALHHHTRLSEGGIKALFTKKVVRIHVISAMKYLWKWLWVKK